MQIVGILTEQVAALLQIELPADTNIYFGETNRIHMQTNHPDAYEKYGSLIPKILSAPDYVRQNEKDSSIEYVKEYKIDNEYVKVAVRAASSNRLYARTLYVLNRSRAEHFIEFGKLIPVSD